jgi:hypothetical protein
MLTYESWRLGQIDYLDDAATPIILYAFRNGKTDAAIQASAPK